jgi:regulatory protein
MSDDPLYKSAMHKAMALCSKKEYCRSEIQDKIYSWGLGKEDAGKIIGTLINEKFIDERRYSAAYARDKFNYNKWGKIKIASNLKQKKIPQELISEALNSIGTEPYRTMIENIISSQRRKIKAKNQYELKAKLLRYGLSKGFESGILYEILGEQE